MTGSLNIMGLKLARRIWLENDWIFNLRLLVGRKERIPN